MIPVLTAAQMRLAETRAMAETGVSSETLMERAGEGATRAIEGRHGQKQRVAILCGKGMNGGDGFVVARLLKTEWTKVYVFAAVSEIRGAAAHHLGLLQKQKRRPSIEFIESEEVWATKAAELQRASVLVDALVGTGSSGAPKHLAAVAITSIRKARGAGARVVALDLPSGLPADEWRSPEWPTVEADLTVTFGALKPALALHPARDLAGRVQVVPLGIAHEFMQASGTLDSVASVQGEIDDVDVRAAFPVRPLDSHKGSFGHVLIVAGSEGKSGAAILAARGALRAGAGLVTVASVESVTRAISAALPEAMTLSLGQGCESAPSATAFDGLVREIEGKGALLVGPGLGRSRATQEFVIDLVAKAAVPVILDADALFSLRVSSPSRLLTREQPTLMTPHPGELATMLAQDTARVLDDRLASVVEVSRQFGATVALKGRRTLVANRDGRVFVNPTGSPALATGGTGDVLAGVLSAIAARGIAPEAAMRAAVFVHGRAGERAGRRRPWGVIASDVADAVPAVLHELRVPRSATL